MLGTEAGVLAEFLDQCYARPCSMKPIVENIKTHTSAFDCIDAD